MPTTYNVFASMREALTELIGAARRWSAAHHERRKRVDLKGDLQIAGRNAEQDLQEALHLAETHILSQHSDDVHVDAMADAMKARLAEKRAEGRGGWDDADHCTVEYLAALLVGAVVKGKSVDVANFAMMLHERNARPAVLTNALINHCARACPPSLEGLADELLTPRENARDAEGHLIHPALPDIDEDVQLDLLLSAFGLETCFVDMEHDDPASFDRYIDSNSADCRYWIPSRPHGDGWVLVEIYDTEDGPTAMYVRRRKEAKASRPLAGNGLALEGRISVRNAAYGDITITLDHYVPRHFDVGAPVVLRLVTDARGEPDNPSEQKLDAPAQVGNVRFGVGIKWATVIAAAKRHHTYMNTAGREAKRIVAAQNFANLICRQVDNTASEAASDPTSVPSLLQQETSAAASARVSCANVDEFISPSAVGAYEVNPEAVNPWLDGVNGDFGAATNADPHGSPPIDGADFHDSALRQSVQGAQPAKEAKNG